MALDPADMFEDQVVISEGLYMTLQIAWQKQNNKDGYSLQQMSSVRHSSWLGRRIRSVLLPW